MIELTEEMRRLVNGARASGNPCIVTSASSDGTPNSGYIGTVMAYDDGSLAYRDRSGREHLKGRASPQVFRNYRPATHPMLP